MRVLVVCALLAGCAVSQPKPTERPLGPGEIVSARAAENSLSVGKSTKSDVRALLGEATALEFGSGYDVWVYRQRPEAKTELVLLFDPSGVLAKTRVR